MTTEEIKAAIQSQIRTNGTGAITGAVLQGVLLDVLAGSKVTDLGNFTTDTALDAAVRSEALRVGEGDTGGVPGVKVILGSSSAGDQRNYLYFALSTGSQTRVVRIDPSTGHLQQTQKAKSASVWSAWAELYDTSGGGGGGSDPDAFVAVASYGRGESLLEMSFSKSGGGTYDTNLPMATDKLAGIMSSADKAKLDKLPNEDLDRVITNIDVLQDAYSFPYMQLYVGEGRSDRVEFPEASATQGGMLSKEDYARFDAAGLPEYSNGQNYGSWDALLTAFKSARPICPCIVTVASEQVLMLQRGIQSSGNGNLLFYCYDCSGVLRSISVKLNSGLATWANNWTVVDFRTQPLVAPYKDADSPRLAVDEWHTEFDAGLWATLTGKDVQYCTGVMKTGGETIIEEGTPAMVLYGEDAGSKKHGFQIWPEGVISGYPASNVYYHTDGTPTDGLNRSTLFKKGSNISFINVTTGLLVSLTSSTLSETNAATMSD